MFYDRNYDSGQYYKITIVISQDHKLWLQLTLLTEP
jgi:hypothetical protein